MSKFKKDNIPWNKGKKGLQKNPYLTELNKSRRGIPISPEVRIKISLAKMGIKNPNWKGDKVSYRALHKWVERYLGKPTVCEHCGKQAMHWANKSGKYLRKLSDWIRLCVKCHRKYDQSQKQ